MTSQEKVVKVEKVEKVETPKKEEKQKSELKPLIVYLTKNEKGYLCLKLYDAKGQPTIGTWLNKKHIDLWTLAKDLEINKSYLIHCFYNKSEKGDFVFINFIKEKPVLFAVTSF